MERQPAQPKPRIYLRKIQPMAPSLASKDTMISIWMGSNPDGNDWSLGSVRLFTIQDAMLHYGRKLRRAAALGGPVETRLPGRSL